MRLKAALLPVIHEMLIFRSRKGCDGSQLTAPFVLGAQVPGSPAGRRRPLGPGGWAERVSIFHSTCVASQLHLLSALNLPP